MKNLLAKNVISICAHIGTQKFNWQPESERFAIGYRNNLLIYNLAFTTFYINRAINFIEKLVYRFGKIYVYGLIIKKDSKFINRIAKINQVVSTSKWHGGFITNIKNFRKTLIKGKKRFAAVASVTYDYQNYSLARESFLIGLPSISVVDSNVRAENFTYPVPINANTFTTTSFFTYILTISIFKGISRRILSRFALKKKLIKSVAKRRHEKIFLKRLKLIYFRGNKLNEMVPITIKIKEKKKLRLFKKLKKVFKSSKYRNKTKQILKRFEDLYDWYREVILIASGYEKLTEYEKLIALFATGYPISRPPYMYSLSELRNSTNNINLVLNGRRGGRNFGLDLLNSNRRPKKLLIKKKKKKKSKKKKLKKKRTKKGKKIKNKKISVKAAERKRQIAKATINKYNIKVLGIKKKRKKKRKKNRKRKFSETAQLNYTLRRYSYLFHKRIRLRLHVRERRRVNRFLELRHFYLKFKKIPKFRNFFEFKIKYTRPSRIREILKGSLKVYKYSIIHAFLSKRRQKIIRIKKIRERRQLKKHRRVYERLIKKKEYRAYYHKFKTPKNSNKETSIF